MALLLFCTLDYISSTPHLCNKLDCNTEQYSKAERREREREITML